MRSSTRKHQIIRGGLILDIEARTATPGDILIEDDCIVEVAGPSLTAPVDAKEVDATNQLLIPGLVNSHTHGHGSLGKGLGDKWSLEVYLNALPWVGGGMTLEDKHTAALLNAAEMILKGCTAAYDMYFEFPTPSLEGLTAVGNAYKALGVRVVLTPMMADTTLYRAIPGLLEGLPEPHRSYAETIYAAPYEVHLERCRTIFDNWPFDRNDVRPALGPTIPLHCSDEFIVGCRDLAIEFDIGVQMHLAETKAQAVSGMRRYGKTLTAHLDDLGILGPRFTGAHCIWLDNDDLSRLADRGASVAHNPGSNLRVGSGIAPARNILAAGINMGIGSDGSATSDSQNMFEAMRMAALVSRVASREPESWLGTWEVLEAGTMSGASTLGMGGAIGRLKAGYKADIVFLDLTNVNFVPFNDAANQIVYCEDSSAVTSVMIGGRMVLWERRFTEFDYDGLRQKVAGTIQRLRAANEEPRTRMEAMSRFVSAHCVGLLHEHYHVRRRIDFDV